MTGIAFLVFVFLVMSCNSFSQLSSQARDSIKRLTLQDHQRMMDILQIISLRPGRDGMNPDSPNAANYDENKANPYPCLPDPLLMKNRKRVDTAGTGYRVGLCHYCTDKFSGRPWRRTYTWSQLAYISDFCGSLF